MRALICSTLDGIDALTVGELPDPELTAGSARVRIEAAGVNFPDLLVTRGTYQDQPQMPFAPGMEVAGTVVETADDVASVAAGDRVFGFLPHGGFAQQTVVPAAALYPMPASMSFETAAALPIAYGTGYHALVDRGRLASGETLLVLGAAGGVGMAAVQIGAAVGAKVVGAVSSEAKERAVAGAGATEVIRYDQEALRDSLRRLAPDGVDVVYDPVGGDMTEAAFRSLAWEGRHLVIGFAAGSIPALPVNLALLKGASLVGVFWGRFAAIDPAANRANFVSLTRMWEEGRIDPVVSDAYPLDDAVEAMRLLAGREAIGKLIVRP
jgi:NADPH2:quinone reductase